MDYILTWKRGDDHLNGFGREFKCSCRIRNEINGERKSDEVVTTIPTGQPFYPREFPAGRWEVFTPVPRTHKYKAPYFIPTSAIQRVEIWETKDGKYFRPSGRFTVDEAYGLHHSTSPTTLGCIKIENRLELVVLVRKIKATLGVGHRVFLNVEE